MHNQRKKAIFSKGNATLTNSTGWAPAQHSAGVLLIGDDKESTPVVYLPKKEVIHFIVEAYFAN